MPRRISAVDHKYAGRQLKKGEPFECDARDLKIMLALGRIVPEEAAPAQAAAAPSAIGPAPTRTQEYATRDMTADGSRRRRAKAA